MWLKENWFKVAIVFLACGALALWQESIRTEKHTTDSAVQTIANTIQYGRY